MDRVRTSDQACGGSQVSNNSAATTQQTTRVNSQGRICVQLQHTYYTLNSQALCPARTHFAIFASLQKLFKRHQSPEAGWTMNAREKAHFWEVRKWVRTRVQKKKTETTGISENFLYNTDECLHNYGNTFCQEWHLQTNAIIFLPKHWINARSICTFFVRYLST